jgi:16S rRNA (cytosine1402-N4)-methyltransferase
MHFPVMVREVVEYLAIRPSGTYVDATCGLGGHTREIAGRLDTGVIIACDRDAESLDLARESAGALAPRIAFVQTTFSDLARTISGMGIGEVDGLLADLGVSRFQLTEPHRGFSILADGPLDMRMDQSQGMPASDLVNYSAEKALAGLIFQYGEERRARRIARAIVRARPIRSTRHLADVVERAAPRTGPLHPATRTFMALRIQVNDEQGELDRLLETAPDLVAKGGRIVIVSFMSLEDRKVKEKFRELARNGRATLLTKRPIPPAEDEVTKNPPSRSAKLRAVEMV